MGAECGPEVQKDQWETPQLKEQGDLRRIVQAGPGGGPVDFAFSAASGP